MHIYKSSLDRLNLIIHKRKMKLDSFLKFLKSIQKPKKSLNKKIKIFKRRNKFSNLFDLLLKPLV